MHDLAGFVPMLIKERIIEKLKSMSHRKVPMSSIIAAETIPVFGYVMFLDISGFTPMTETFSKFGPEGAEEVRLLLCDFFGKLAEIIEAFGGLLLVSINSSVARGLTNQTCENFKIIYWKIYFKHKQQK